MSDGHDNPEDFPKKENHSTQYISIDDSIKLSKAARLELAKKIWRCPCACQSFYSSSDKS